MYNLLALTASADVGEGWVGDGGVKIACGATALFYLVISRGEAIL
jgi:hypothetical protein